MLTNLLAGHKVYLTALDKADVSTLVRWHQDTAYLRLQDSRLAQPHSEAATAAWLDEIDQSKNSFTFAIRALDNDALIGTAGVDEISGRTGWASSSLALVSGKTGTAATAAMPAAWCYLRL